MCFLNALEPIKDAKNTYMIHNMVIFSKNSKPLQKTPFLANFTSKGFFTPKMDRTGIIGPENIEKCRKCHEMGFLLSNDNFSKD